MTTGPIDTSGTIEIGNAPARLALYLAGALAFVAIGLWIIRQTAPTSGTADMIMLVIGWFSVVFFGWIALIAAQRMIWTRTPVITISPEGIRDIRVSPDLIPWTAIRSITTWQLQGTAIMVLGLASGEEEKLRLSAITRMTRRANAALGADGLSIATQGTKISHDRLMDITIAYADRYTRH